LNPVDLISASPWRQAIFTTYSLSLSFFEAVVLDALVRGGGREALILADVSGVRGALMEQGARGAGREYLVEPIAVNVGVFHAKISAFVAKDDCHMLVGSGNLTFGGWGGNFEVCEHLHPSFAPDAIADASEFFEYLSVSDSRFRHGAAERCSAIAEELKSAIQGRALKGDIRLFHNLDGGISEKLAEQVDRLGGATRLVVAAPFWDGGKAIDRLCQLIGLDEVFVHSHVHGTVEGRAGSNWPYHCASKIHAVRLETMAEDKPRRLHAKVFEVSCRHGRIVMSGSPNATWAALEAGQNVEACIVRIQRERTVGWLFSAAEPPAPIPANDDMADDQEIEVGVLRAELDFDHIVGQVLTPKMAGPASVFQITSGTTIPLGDTNLREDGSFEIATPELEREAWKGRRMTLRVQSDAGMRSEGFVSVAAFSEISRRAGSLAPRLMAIIAGTETPADVAAIFSWFNEDPRRLGTASRTPSGGGYLADQSHVDATRTIPVAELDPIFAMSVPTSGGLKSSEDIAWKRFMEHVFAAFRERRDAFASGHEGVLEDDDEKGDGEEEDGEIVMVVDPAAAHALKIFETLFELMLSEENESKHAVTAYELMRYVCDRLKPDPSKVRKWLARVADAFTRVECPPESRENIAAVFLSLLGTGPQDNASLRKARSRLLRIGIQMSGPAPSLTHAHSFQDIMLPGLTFDHLWPAVQNIRTFSEQVKEYLGALHRNAPSTGYPDFEREAREEWPTLRDAIVSENARKRLRVIKQQSDACPKCHMILAIFERNKLRSVHVATCRSCGRIIICEG
jgi:hypothetical protein